MTIPPPAKPLGEFDESAANDAWNRNPSFNNGQNFINGARWQHAQDEAKLAALMGPRVYGQRDGKHGGRFWDDHPPGEDKHGDPGEDAFEDREKNVAAYLFNIQPLVAEKDTAEGLLREITECMLNDNQKTMYGDLYDRARKLLEAETP